VIRSSARRLARGATLALLVLSSLALLTPLSASAATVLSTSGSAGHYSFTDSVGSPGARCIYQGAAGSQNFDRMKVNAPTIYWPSANAFPNGTVGWRIRLQHFNAGTWTTVRQSKEYRGFATKTVAASLGDRVIAYAPPHTQKYRAVVVVRWMTPDAETIGSATVLIDHYRRGYDGSVGPSCKAVVPSF
jgi:hypothetical protein